MINPKDFYKKLVKNRISFFTGVPDSLLKNFLDQLENKNKNRHLSVGNEGIAVGLATGHYLSSGKLALVYLQNSGLGNAINPLNSITNRKVYGIPMVLMIGWRGEIKKKNKQIKDEPQHLYQGKITLKQLKLIDIPYKIISEKTKNFEEIIRKIVKKSIKESRPVALIIKKNTFESLRIKKNKKKILNLNSRFNFINALLEKVSDKTLIISTTGYTSRELYKLRLLRNEKRSKDFLMVGGMGHAISVAAGIAKNKSNRKIICIDGDGSLLMHTSSMQNSSLMKNFIHLLINNGVHESVGGQKINSKSLNYKQICKGFGYKNYFRVSSLNNFELVLKKSFKLKESVFIEVLTNPGSVINLPRPKENFNQRKFLFQKYLGLRK
jgi:phosphonopyruvate decarboxylase